MATDYYCDCGLILMQPESILSGCCEDCRGIGEPGFYEKELRRRAEEKRLRLIDEPMRRFAALRLRIYGPSRHPTGALTAAESRGRTMGTC